MALGALWVTGLQALWPQVTVGFDEPHNPLIMSVPDEPAALQVDLLHLKLEQNQLDKSVSRRKVQASDARGWEFSAFIYPVDKNQTAAELSEEAFLGFRKGATDHGLKVEGMKTFDRGDFSMREYSIPDFQGKPIHQRSVFGYAVSGDMGLDFHISKGSYSAADDKFFDSLISGVRLIPITNPTVQPNSGMEAFSIYDRIGPERPRTMKNHCNSKGKPRPESNTMERPGGQSGNGVWHVE
jgi:hypothetical protein